MLQRHGHAFFTVGIYRGGGQQCHSDLCFVVKSVPHLKNVLYDFWNISRNNRNKHSEISIPK